MLRKYIRASLFAAFGMLAMLLAYGASATAEEKDKKDEKLPEISEIMKKGHDKTDGYIAKVRGAAKDGKWEDAQKYAKTLAFFGEHLGKNKPPKGDEKSWETLTKKYNENTKAVQKATDAKDAAQTKTALGAIGKSCGECHKSHK